MDRSQKEAAVAELKRTFEATNVVVVTRNLGLSVAQSSDLRNRMREAGARYKVAKNRLALLALEGTIYAPLGDLFNGPIALATSDDPVAAAKAAVDFAKTHDRLEIVGGAMGETPARRRGRQGARRFALARRAARQADRPRPGAGDQARPARQRARGQARPRLRRLCGEGSGLGTD